MKITAQTEELKKIVNIALQYVSKFNTTPELTCFVMTIYQNELLIKGSDGDKQIEIKMAVEGDNGEVMVEALKFSSMVNALEGKDCTVEMVGDNVILKSQKDKYELRSMTGNWFGLMPAQGDAFKLPSQKIIDAINRVLFLIPGKANFPVYTGMMFEIDKDIHMAGTDGFRVAVCKVTGDYGKSNQISIPRGALQPIASALDFIGDDVQVTIEANKVTFGGEKCMVSSGLLLGEFPAYKTITGIQTKEEFEIDAKYLDSCISKASVIMDFAEKVCKVDLIVTPEGIKTVASTDISNVESEYPVKTTDTISVQVDIRYLTNITKFIGENQVKLRINKEAMLVLVNNLEGENVYAFKALEIK